MDLLTKYEPPSWAEKIQNTPKYKLKLANLPTPIEPWILPGIPEGVHVFIKRDDMTGGFGEGNKLRRVEFLLADCIATGCTHVITCGHYLSNHCRTVAASVRQVGLQSHLLLRSNIQDVDKLVCCTNLLLARQFGAHVYIVPHNSDYDAHVYPRMDMLAHHIRSVSGERSYQIPVGGSGAVGLWGYIDAFRELIDQGILENFDDIVCATGSGATAEGLALANYLTGSKLRVHGVAIGDDAAFFHSHCQGMIELVGLHVKSEEILDVIDGHVGQGYGITSQEILDFVVAVARSTGILLDPTYTGKAANGLLKELTNNPHRFRGRRILFLHTGGALGLLDGRINPTLLMDDKLSNNTRTWTFKDCPPF